MIPFGDLSRSYERLRPQIDAAVAEVMADGWFVLGARVEAFEAEFAGYCQVEHAIGVGNGTDAIALALRAVGVEPGDEVITSPFSAAFTALAVSQIGAQPVFVDVDPDDLTLDPEAVAAAVTPRTAAILPVHLYGLPADMDPLLRVAADHGLAVVEDAAQAHGARYRGRRVGGLSDAAAFSFYPSKNLGAFGDGGAVTTNDASVAERVRQLRDGGQSSRYRHELQGVNSRLDEIQAAVLSVRLAYLDSDNERRGLIARQYTSAVGDAPGLLLPGATGAEGHAHHLYALLSEDRGLMAERLAQEGVATAVHYPTPIHMQPAYGGPARQGEFPVAEAAADQVLSLPLFPELSDEEVAAVCDAIGSVGRATQPAVTGD